MRTKIFVTGVFVFLAVALVSIWVRTEGFPLIKENGEVFYNYLAAKNWERFGLLKNAFLEDFATSPETEAHPYYYTHNPDFPKLISYLFLKSGVRDIRVHILFALPVFLLGIWYFYRMSRKFLGEREALWVLFFSSTSYMISLAWGLNFFRAWSWILFCGPIYHLKAREEARESGEARRHTLMFVVWFALGAFYDYSFFLFCLLVILGLKFFGLYKLSWKRLVLFLCGAGLPMIVLHQACVIAGVGLDIWWKDWVYTLGNRVRGIPSREALREFYEQAGLVLWGYPGPFQFSKVIKKILNGFILYFGIIMAFMSLLGLMIFPILFWQRLKGGKAMGEVGNSFRFLAALSGGVLGMALLAWQHFVVIYTPVGVFFPLYLFWAFPCCAVVICILLKTGHSVPGKIIFISLLLVNYGWAQIRSLKESPPRIMPGAKVLEKYRGHTFLTNSLVPAVNYFTHHWVTDGRGGEMAYVFERDKLKNPDKYRNPDFFLCENCSANALKVVEEGPFWRIYDLRTGF